LYKLNIQSFVGMLATLVILVFKFVSSVWQIGGFLLVLRFSLPIKPLGRRGGT
jgi:hypothetical protein